MAHGLKPWNVEQSKGTEILTKVFWNGNNGSFPRPPRCQDTQFTGNRKNLLVDIVRLLHKTVCLQKPTGTTEPRAPRSSVKKSFRLIKYYAKGSAIQQFRVFTFWLHQSCWNFLLHFRASMEKSMVKVRALSTISNKAACAERKSVKTRASSPYLYFMHLSR